MEWWRCLQVNAPRLADLNLTYKMKIDSRQRAESFLKSR
jgi:hypothetical protein